jgi:hypothetical protein
MPARLENAGLLADHLTLRIAGDLAKRAIDGGDTALCIEHHDRLGGVLEYGVGLTQLVVDLAAFGDVAKDQHHALGLAVRNDRRADVFDREKAAVPPQKIVVTALYHLALVQRAEDGTFRLRE